MRAFVFVFLASLVLGSPGFSFANTIRPGRPPQQAVQPQTQGKQAGQGEPGVRKQESQAGASDATGGGQALSPALPGERPDEADNAAVQAREAQGQVPGGEGISLNSLGNAVGQLAGQPLVLPETSENMEFLNGGWIFDRELRGSDGDPVSWTFSVKNGSGVAVLKDRQNNVYEAPLTAKLEDGVLRMRTDAFASKTSPKIYNSEYIECRNGANGAMCKGSDGFGEWSGERIFPAPGAVLKAGEPAGATLRPGVELVELAADGAELPAEILANVRKAANTREGVGALAGHWRYSQDLARKADGAPVSMEFHFDGEGKGYSLIKGDPEGDFRAEAQVQAMPGGKLRIKTGEYANGQGKGYYPTFMECEAQADQPLTCNLSNGWMRSDNGMLVDLNSYQENMSRARMEDLLPGAPGESAPQSMEELLAGAAEGMQQPEAPAQKADAIGSAILQLPQKGDSVSFMEGSWICHTGLANATTGEPVVMQFSFNKNGKGTAIIVERKSGQRYRATAQASFRNGVLRVNTSQFRGKSDGYNANSIECRDREGVAQCQGSNSGLRWNAKFARQ